MHKQIRIALLAALAGTLLPWSAQAGFGFGFDSDNGFYDNGFYDYDSEDYPWGYPPPGYRDYNPRWRWGYDHHRSDWHWGNEDARDNHEEDGWSKPRRRSRWDRSWTFGDWGDDDTTRFSFGPQKFHFGDSWKPSWNDSWGHRRYRYPRYPAWGPYPYAPAPAWGAYPPPRPWWGVPAAGSRSEAADQGAAAAERKAGDAGQPRVERQKAAADKAGDSPAK